MTPKKSDEPPDAVFLQIAVLAGIPSAVQIEQFVRSLKSAVATISGHAGGLRQGAKAADRKIARDIFKFSGELDKRLAPLDTAPEGKLKAVGGAVRDEWNARLLTLVASALPVNQAAGNTEADEAATAALSGMVDMKPADPVEGVLIGQLIVASEAALSMYRRAWEQPPEYFEARMKYLAHADRATRTVALLTERLDQHRGRGQQQITVKHVTVNADQAMVADQIVGGKLEPLSATKLVTAIADKPMEIIEARSTEAMPVEGGRIKAEMSDNPMHKAHEAPRCRAKSKRTAKPCRSPAVEGYRVCRMHGARGGAPAGNRNGNYRHGARARETIETARLIKTIRRRVQ